MLGDVGNSLEVVVASITEVRRAETEEHRHLYIKKNEVMRLRYLLTIYSKITLKNITKHVISRKQY